MYWAPEKSLLRILVFIILNKGSFSHKLEPFKSNPFSFKNIVFIIKYYDILETSFKKRYAIEGHLDRIKTIFFLFLRLFFSLNQRHSVNNQLFASL